MVKIKIKPHDVENNYKAFLLEKFMNQFINDNKSFIEDVTNISHDMAMFKVKYGFNYFDLLEEYKKNGNK